jgi:hypothetical protein
MQPGYGKYTRIGRHCSPVSFCLCLTASSETFLSYRTTKCQGFTDLSKEGRGYVIVDESKADFIVYNPAFAIDPEGKIGTTDGQGKGWILSVYHQLHCLVSTVGGKMQQQVRSHRNSLKPHNLKTIKQQLNVDVQ